MKRALLIVSVFFVLFSAAGTSQEKRFGFGFSFCGNTEAQTEIEVNALFKITESIFFRAEGGLSLVSGKKGLSFSSPSLTLNAELFRSMKNPLQFTMANPGPWSPSVSLGAVYEEKTVRPYGEISLLRTLDKDYMYEYFVLSSSFDKTGFKTVSVYFLRMTALY